MIRIVNKRVDLVDDDHTFKCYRPSPLGNPWEMETEADRDRVIDNYIPWLERQLEIGNPRVTKEILKLINHYKEHGQLTLQCWCHPKRCHCDVIKDTIERLIID